MTIVIHNGCGMQKKNMNNNLFLTSAIMVFAGFLLLIPIGEVVGTNNWSLHVSNLSGNSVTISYDDLLAMPKTIVSGDLSCYGLLLTSANWGGVKLKTLLDQVGIDPQALSVDFTAQDGYTVAIPVERAVQSDVVVAYEREGEVLSEALRLVVPEANGNVWIAMIISITLSTSASQIEGRYVTAGITPLDGIPSSLVPTVQNSSQGAEKIVEPTEQAGEQLNETATPVVTPSVTDENPSQQQSQEDSRLAVQEEIRYCVALVLVAAVLATAGYLTYKRRKGDSV